jgi:hypothetical protein
MGKDTTKARSRYRPDAIYRIQKDGACDTCGMRFEGMHGEFYAGEHARREPDHEIRLRIMRLVCWGPRYREAARGDGGATP